MGLYIYLENRGINNGDEIMNLNKYKIEFCYKCKYKMSAQTCGRSKDVIYVTSTLIDDSHIKECLDNNYYEHE